MSIFCYCSYTVIRPASCFPGLALHRLCFSCLGVPGHPAFVNLACHLPGAQSTATDGNEEELPLLQKSPGLDVNLRTPMVRESDQKCSSFLHEVKQSKQFQN